MTTPILTFFNNKGGVGKTSLVYHLAWMFASMNKRIIAVDLDPQANLTAAFLMDDRIESLWNEQGTGATIYQCVKPLTGVSDIIKAKVQNIAPDLYLIPGDVELSKFEDTLSTEWPKSMDDTNLERPMLILSSFWRIMQNAAEENQADIILVDIGPNLGAINRSVLLATDYVAIPLGADLFSLQGLKNLGPTLRSWRSNWKRRLDNWEKSKEKISDVKFPEGKMSPVGYLCQQHGVRLDRPVKAYDKWLARIPGVYRESVLDEHNSITNVTTEDDPYCLATLKHYRSLIPMAQECRKPVFNLSSADGAIGSHANAVADAKRDFRELALKLAKHVGVVL